MKFDLMYHLGLSNEDMMRMGLDELIFLHSKTKDEKDKELLFEKTKLEATLLAAGVKQAKGMFG